MKKIVFLHRYLPYYDIQNIIQTNFLIEKEYVILKPIEA